MQWINTGKSHFYILIDLQTFKYIYINAKVCKRNWENVESKNQSSPVKTGALGTVAVKLEK